MSAYDYRGELELPASADAVFAHLIVEHEAESEEEPASYQQGWEFSPQLGDAAAASE